MGTITLQRVTAGTEITTNEFNNNATTLEDEINGNLENINIDAAAAIAVSKLAGGTNGQYLRSVGTTPTWQTVAMPLLVETSGVAVDVANTTAETAVFSETIAANALGTNGSLNIRMTGDYLNNSGGNRILNVVVRIGAVDVFDDDTENIVLSGIRRPWLLDLTISNENSAAVQYIVGHFRMGTLASTVAGTGDIGADMTLNRLIAGAATFDTTTAMLVEVRAQHPTAHASLSFRKRHHSITLNPS